MNEMTCCRAGKSSKNLYSNPVSSFFFSPGLWRRGISPPPRALPCFFCLSFSCSSFRKPHSILAWCPPHAPTLSVCAVFCGWGAGNARASAEVSTRRCPHTVCTIFRIPTRLTMFFRCLNIHTHLAVGSLVSESFSFIKLRFGFEPEPRLASQDMTRRPTTWRKHGQQQLQSCSSRLCTAFLRPDLRTGECLTALRAHVAAGRVRRQWHQPPAFLHHLVRKACHRHGPQSSCRIGPKSKTSRLSTLALCNFPVALSLITRS